MGSASSLRALNRSLNASELPVVVFPFAPGHDLFGRVPVFDQFASGDPEQVVEGGMDAVGVSLANAQHETALCQHTMDLLVVDLSATVLHGLQRGP